jgi:hypothetical protein
MEHWIRKRPDPINASFEWLQAQIAGKKLEMKKL